MQEKEPLHRSKRRGTLCRKGMGLSPGAVEMNSHVLCPNASIPRMLPIVIITKCKACPNCFDNHVEWPTCKLEKRPEGQSYPTWLTNAYTMIPIPRKWWYITLILADLLFFPGLFGACSLIQFMQDTKLESLNYFMLLAWGFTLWFVEPRSELMGLVPLAFCLVYLYLIVKSLLKAKSIKA